ncbi:hypothetical protein [Salinibacterium sp. SWN1162]|uniref:hypothetical protein n=1 Tax=Salinibacterium sp. SWN1162 TaxID=2792053 RepID=UPI0018CD429E|nr:hypothetical protein [Salinibacterium sp. SWN1162]MBH0007812.1 hypothetical protein [Salinibacterium sp. SWN1162]
MTPAKQSYIATARKDGDWWLIEVPELDAVGQARSVTECTTVAREIIGLCLDVEPKIIDVTVTIEKLGARDIPQTLDRSSDALSAEWKPQTTLRLGAIEPEFTSAYYG